MSDFDSAVTDAVLRHMNDDHVEDSLLIVRAFGDRAAVSTRMTRVTTTAGEWEYQVAGDTASRTLVIPWRAPITERLEIRQEIVALHDRACRDMGVAP